MPTHPATILLTGATGQVGGELASLLKGFARITAPDRNALDLSDPTSIRRVVSGSKPDIIVNAAAYTAVDKAQSESALAFAVNADAPAVLAEEAARAGALLVHFSTDYVFNGSKRSPYVETDSPDPLNVYGQSKAAGEAAVTNLAGDHVVLRTSWVFGPSGANFPRTILRLAREREELRIVDDQVGTPTSSVFLARLTLTFIQRWLADRTGPFSSGIYHATAIGHTTWFRFAQAILEGDPRRHEQLVRRMIPITTAEYPVPATRPLYSVLDCSKLDAAFGAARSGWQDQLRDTLRALAA